MHRSVEAFFVEGYTIRVFAKTKFGFGLGLFFTSRPKSAGSLGPWVVHKAKLVSKTAGKDRCGLAQFGLSRDTPTEVSAETGAQRTP